MASEKDDKKKAKPAAAKAEAADEAAEKPAKAEKAAKPAKKAAAAAPSGPPCRVDGCKQPVRAKGYCRKHFIAWRRGEVGDHHRYKICSKEACRKPRTKGGFCDEHAGVAPAAAAPAAEGGAPA
ncbi:MAG TPA: hypothetical protein VN903_24375 [Polyangia bacterium]|nr:hypothetical protein [Polyangia bacterium]